MPTYSPHLEDTLHRAVGYANERRHEYATLEHLLLALADDPDASEVMRACNVDLVQLKTNLTTYVDTELKSLVVDDGEDATPTAGFQRVIARAVNHVKSSGRDEVTGANVLVAVFAEQESHAAHFLKEQKMTRRDAVDVIVHGARKPGGSKARNRAPAGRGYWIGAVFMVVAAVLEATFVASRYFPLAQLRHWLQAAALIAMALGVAIWAPSAWRTGSTKG